MSTNTITPTAQHIDAGIGNIRYTTNNLLLDQVMESLAECIQREGALNILKALESRRKRPS